MKESGVDMEVEEASEEDPGEASDEEEWSDGRKKRKRRGAPGGIRGGRKNNATTLSVNIPPTQGFTPDPKPFSCNCKFSRSLENFSYCTCSFRL